MMRALYKKIIAAVVNMSMIIGMMYFPVNASDAEPGAGKGDTVVYNTPDDPANTLSVPEKPHWKEEALLTAAWDAVEGADYYDIVVRVYEGETFVGEQTTGTSNCEADLQQEVRAIARGDAYIVSVDFKVSAKNTDSELVSEYSDFSEKKDYCINAMDTIDPPEEVILSIEEDTVLVSFTPVENADHYIVSSYFVKDNVGIGGSVKTNDGKHDIVMLDGYCVVDISNDFHDSYRAYIGESVHLVANVQAVTTSGGVSERSAESNGVDYKKDSSLSTPEIVSIVLAEDGRVLCTFNDETEADDREIDIVFRNFVSGEGGIERDPNERTTRLMGMLNEFCGRPEKKESGEYELDIYPILRYWLHFLNAIDPTAMTDVEIRIRSIKDDVPSNFSNMVEIKDLITEPYYIAPAEVLLEEGENGSYSISFNREGDATYYLVDYYIYTDTCRAGDSIECSADQIEWNEDRGSIDVTTEIKDLYNRLAGDHILFADAVVRGRSADGREYGLKSAYSNRARVYPFKTLVKEMTLFPETPILAVGKSLYLGKTVDPHDGYYEEIIWTSGNESVATVNALGKITGIAEGSTVVTAVVDKTIRTSVSVNIYKMNSNLDDTEGGDSAISQAEDLIDGIANEDDPDVSNTDIDPDDVDEIRDEIREAIEDGDTFHTDINYIQQYFEEYKKNWGQIQKAAKNLNAHFEGAYSIEVEMYHKDKDDNDHHIGNITELEDEVTFTFDLPTGMKEEESGETKKYVLVRIHVNKNGETEYSPLDFTINEDGTLTAKSDQFSEFVIVSIDDHVHDYTYSADGAVLTATCSNGDGKHVGDVSSTITIVAPALVRCGGTESKEATITGSIAGVELPAIVYKHGNDVLDEAPAAAGTYTANITLGDATASVEYTILGPVEYTVTFKVENGAWNDGTTDDKVVTLNGYERDVLTVSADRIPEAGNKPAVNFEAGEWDKVPTTTAAITEDTTYVYTYKAKDTVTIGMKIREGSSISIDPGESKQLNVVMEPSNASCANVIWSSSNETVATVDDKGLVSAIAIGVAEISVSSKDGKCSAKCTVNVVDKSGEIYAEFEDGNTYAYTGGKITPAISVYKGKTKLTEGVDYTVTYSNNIKAGTGKVTVNGKILAFSVTRTFTITQVDIADETMVKGDGVIKINKNAKAAPVLYYGSYKFTAKDYTIDGSNKFSADGELLITGKGNFKGTRKFEVRICKAAKISVKIPKTPVFTYDGREHKLTEGVDYTVNGTYDIVYQSDVVNAGTVKVTFIGTGDYTGTVTKSYKIAPDKDADIEVKLAEDTVEYSALGAFPAVSVKISGGSELVAGKDYKLTYSGNKAVTDKAKVNVTFIGNYKGVKAQSRSFKIVAAGLNETNAKVYCADLAFVSAGKYLSAPYVNVDNVALAKSDYTVAYYIGERDITNARITDADFGNSDTLHVTVKITLGGKAKSKYIGSLNGAYTITKTDSEHDLSKAKVQLLKDGKALRSVEYTGHPIELGDDVSVVITVGKNKTVVPVGEYELHYSNNINKGKATVIISAKEGSSYYGSKAVSFTISKGTIKWF